MWLLEVGCGVGNAALPLLEVNPHLNVVAIDFAEKAVELFRVREKNDIVHSFVYTCL
jgi:2-polyprenyl-3-methyl-5-hydroxy-6-metoxy-1,4-benzoquinol methylase